MDNATESIDDELALEIFHILIAASENCTALRLAMSGPLHECDHQAVRFLRGLTRSLPIGVKRRPQQPGVELFAVIPG